LCFGFGHPSYNYNRGQEIPNSNNLGFSHMAAALLAFQHFNERDPSVVPELSDPRFAKENCNFRFDINSSTFYDTQVFSNKPPQDVLDHVLHHGSPCAMAGPYFDKAGFDLATMATSLQVPIVAHHLLDPKFTMDVFYPYMTPANAFSMGFALPMVDFLQRRGRTNHISFLHSIKPQYQTMVGAISNVLERQGIRTKLHPYFSGGLNINNQAGIQPLKIDNVFSRLKSAGFRTIVVFTNEMDLLRDLPAMANEAERLGMNSGTYFWVFCTGIPPGTVSWAKHNKNITKLLRGAAVIDYADGFSIDKEADRFLQSWRTQNATMIDTLRAHNPIPVGMPGHYAPNQDYFQAVDPDPGAGFMYDSIMAIGMGACLSEPRESGLVVTDGLSHVQGIRAVNFSGASGRMWFEKGFAAGSLGLRNFTSGMYAVYNLLPPGGGGDYVLTEVWDLARSSVTLPHDDETTNSWIPVEEFVFADGRTVGPDLLRDTPEQNHLSRSVRNFGLSLLGIAACLAVASAVWIVLHREHRVLKAAQPALLLVLCFGALSESFTILAFSFDESYDLSTERLGRLCILGPWMFIIGHMVSYSALFAKVRCIFLLIE
jgi:hypothetical protein